MTDRTDAHQLLSDGRGAVAEAADQGIPLRLMGGVAVLARCDSAERPPLSRDYNDLDFFALSKDSRRLEEMLGARGYAPEPRFNSLHGHRRLLFKEASGRHVDVLLDQFEMCHKFDLRKRLEAEPDTISLADLALTKLQVVEANEKDLTDIVALFADHELGEGNGTIDASYVADLCSGDWGLTKTLSISIDRAREYAKELPELEGREVVVERLAELARRIEEVPKSRRWKARARIGERTRWYQEPQEV